MQTNRSLLGKRSSFSNFSTFKAPTSPSGPRALGDEMYDANGGPTPSAAAQAMYTPQHFNMAAQQQQQQYLPRRSAYYESHWPLYSADWTSAEWGNNELMAVGTFSEDANNRIQILHINRTMDPMTSVSSMEFQSTAESMIPYPATKVGWEPRPTGASNSGPNTIKMISTADCLRLWDYDMEYAKLHQRCTLLNSKSEFMPPLTSFDWNKVDPSLVITSSIDTTCTIWDINTSSAKTQLIAHDNEVYDVTFLSGSVDIFTSVGADGSVRVFDLRSLDHSTIIYEPSKPVPLLRVAANPHDRNTLATIAAGSNKVYVLDIRAPSTPVATLDAHQKTVNSIAWAPVGTGGRSLRHSLASAGDDCQVLLWDLAHGDGNNPLACAYTDSAEVNNLSWSSQGDWMGVVSGRGIQGVRV